MKERILKAFKKDCNEQCVFTPSSKVGLGCQAYVNDDVRT